VFPRLRRRAVVLLATSAAIIGVVAWALDVRGGSGLSVGDRTACTHATPLRKVKGAGSTRPYSIARLTSFDVVGVSGPTDVVATDPLYPRYPTALLPGHFGIDAHHALAAPVVLSAFYCSGGAVGLFSFTGTKGGPNLPRPASAAVVRTAGSRQATLFWPPPISAPPDPPSWLVTPFFYKPGLAVVRFAQRGKVIDRLTFRVCVAGGPFLTCR
jgi:hypothetical protein